MGPASGPAGGDRSLSGTPTDAERAAPVPPGSLRVVVTYLEMRAAPKRTSGPPPFADVALRRLVKPSVAAYRFLYDSVGEPWLWNERRRLGETALRAVIEDPRLEILVLTVAGRVAGFAEIDHRPAPDSRLAYFGLLPAYIGRGLGRWFLARAVERAWKSRPRHLLVNTCSFDHPAALPLYRRAGFTVVEHVERTFRDPRLAGILPLGAAPHIPLAAPPEPPSPDTVVVDFLRVWGENGRPPHREDTDS
ncbi:MAG: GNAT family N-acetyltransferase [Rhodospirillaceae bacterium]